MVQMTNLTYIKGQVKLISNSLEEINQFHYNSISPEVDALLRQIEFAADEIIMSIQNDEYSSPSEESRERN